MATKSTSYEDFKQEYLAEFTDDLSTVEKGRRFAKKLVEDFYELPDSADWNYCGGPGDGGIDIAILDRQGGEEEEDQQEDVKGDTWYLIQSKYSSQSHPSHFHEEAKKIVATLTDKHEEKLSDTGKEITQRLKYFLKNSSDKDRLIIVFVTQNPIEQKTLDHIRQQNQQTFPSLHFDVQNISIKSIYYNLFTKAQDISLNLRGHFQTQKSKLNNTLLVGTVTLENLYRFLKEYQKGTNNLDLIYEYNIRQYLGNQKKVNKQIQETLKDDPTRFGLYNNGITFVVADYTKRKNTLKLTNPYIINGCQTTRSIFDVLDTRLNSGGTSKKSRDLKLEDWKEAIKESSIIIKLIKVDQSDQDLINNITQYTNTQNAIAKADFNALNKKIRSIQKCFNQQYSNEVYLEFQRGRYEVEKKRRQSQGRSDELPNKHVKIDELLKIYGSGWFRQPGPMFYDAQSIRPEGTIYRQLFENEKSKFGHEDFYAAYLLKQDSTEKEFKLGEQKKMKQLYYFTVMELLRFVVKQVLNTSSEDKNMTDEERDTNERQALTKALIKIFKNEEAKDKLLNIAYYVVKQYLNENSNYALRKEDRYHELNDLTVFLRGNNLGHDTLFEILLDHNKRYMEMAESGFALNKIRAVLARKE